VPATWRSLNGWSPLTWNCWPPEVIDRDGYCASGLVGRSWQDTATTTGTGQTAGRSAELSWGASSESARLNVSKGIRTQASRVPDGAIRERQRLVVEGAILRRCRIAANRRGDAGKRPPLSRTFSRVASRAIRRNPEGGRYAPFLNCWAGSP